MEDYGYTHKSNVTIVIYLTDTSFNSTILIKLLGQRAVNFTKGFKKQEKAFLKGLLYVCLILIFVTQKSKNGCYDKSKNNSQLL